MCDMCSTPLMWSDQAGGTSLNSRYLRFQSCAELHDCNQDIHCLTSPLIKAWFTAGQQNTKKAKKEVCQEEMPFCWSKEPDLGLSQMQTGGMS